MAYYCRICGANEVDEQGGICELCAIGQDPYATTMSYSGGSSSGSKRPRVVSAVEDNNQSAYVPENKNKRKMLLGGDELANRDPYGNDMTVRNSGNVQVYHAGQMPDSATVYGSGNSAPAAPVTKPTGNQPLCSGITKNIVTDNQEQSFFSKLFRSIFTGVPFTTDNEVTMFQVFPDYTGSALTASGTACDQVIVYGKVNHGAISENNEVEVFGRRDSHNYIVAKAIRNKATGTTVSPTGAVNAWVIRIAVLFLLLTVIGILGEIGIGGILCIGLIVLALFNLPLVFKIIGGLLKGIWNLIKSLFS